MGWYSDKKAAYENSEQTKADNRAYERLRELREAEKAARQHRKDFERGKRNN